MSEIEKFRLAQEQREKQLEEKRRATIRERLKREKEEADRRKKEAEEATKAAEEAAAKNEQAKGNAGAENPSSGKNSVEKKPTLDEKDASSERKRSRDSSRERSRRRSREKSRDRSRDRDRRRSDRRRHDSDRRRHRHRSRSRSRSYERDRDRRHRKRHRSRSGSRDKYHKSPSKPKEEQVPEVTKKQKVIVGLKLQPAAQKKERSKPAPSSSAPVFAADDDVEEKPVREIVPIDYTEEEKLAAAPIQQRIAVALARINSRSDDIKSLIGCIPTDKETLFAFPIEWDSVDKNNIVKEKMTPWIAKKIKEYLGEEESTMIEFIENKLNSHTKAEDILNELQLVLEDDAEVFVKLMWRKLAFEAIRGGQFKEKKD